jgi:hypothetical protein
MEMSGQLHAPASTTEIAPSTHWIGCLVGPRAGVDAVEKRNILPSREWNWGRLARSYTDWATDFLVYKEYTKN